MNKSREFDIIIWGASGFTGRLVAEYLFKQYGTSGNLKWAMAGRNQEKLENVRASIADTSVPIVVSDSSDEASIKQMVLRTKVICTTVGPYAIYGSKLVAACVENKAHYCDLAGEVQWMRQMIDKHQEAAQANGVKIVHSCGFDSIPSDMGVYFIQREAKAQKGQRAKKISMRVAAMKGGLSGGTYASLSKVMEQAQQDKSIYKVLTNPYGLNPTDQQEGEDRPDLMSVVFDKTSQSYVGPFIMAGINTKVVRRSNALSNYSYGKDFRYDEATLSGKGFKGKMRGILAAIPLMFMTAKPKSVLKSIANKLLPKPGEGPNKEQRENGFYNLRFYVTLEDGSSAMGKVTGDKDPGYGSTSKMLGETAVCLAVDELPKISGVLTPSVSMGEALLQRLEQSAGLTFSLK
ncbi:MAG: saccharopine dehydrogenase NADP-binding domain-containing protein [Flavobacteriaceae bacterium]|nr:saccharopine dehydrogenase NADP-binding domain-containing protein [Flavobacteriaceae bacterium]